MAARIVMLDAMNIPITTVAELGTILTVWAHPDDESYLAGGVMAIAADAGAPVTCVTATNGDFADGHANRFAIRATRRAELAAALDELGVVDRVALDHPDGGCDRVDPARPVNELSRIICGRAPDTIITFGPDGFTGHPDHCAVSRWTLEAVRQTNSRARILHPARTAAMHAVDVDITGRFPIFEAGHPTLHDDDEISVEVELSERRLDTKLRALRAHTSQTAGLIEAIGEPRFRTWVSVETFVDAAAVGGPTARVPELHRSR